MVTVAHRSGVDRIVRNLLARATLAALCATGAIVAHAGEADSTQAGSSQQSGSPQPGVAQTAGSAAARTTEQNAAKAVAKKTALLLAQNGGPQSGAQNTASQAVAQKTTQGTAQKNALLLAQNPAPQVVAQNTAPQTVAQNTAATTGPTQAASPGPLGDQPQEAPQSVDQVVVSGSRIVRDGYSSPTPVSVINTDVLQSNATSNVADLLNTMPNFAGSSTPQTSAVTVTSGQQAVNALNIGGLGATRTLVLVNGQRTVGSLLTGVVDISELPQQLITRVDVVTGGASAGYGSDALTGIVNIVLDTKFTGVKAEVSGGETNYSDDRNWRANITAGTAFADGRGHAVISGEEDVDDGLLIANRPWNNNGWGYITNPNYTAKNGQPLDILTNHLGVDTASYGGTIASGPYRGTMFGAGGAQTNETFGSIVSDPLMSGGSWASQTVGNVLGAAIAPEQRRQNVFGRVSFDVTDNAEVYGQVSYSHLFSFSDSVPVFYPGNLTMSATNAFLPANIATGLAAADQTSFKYGTFNNDLGIQHPVTDRKVTRTLVGADGKFDLFNTKWSWDGYASFGVSQQDVISGNTINVPNYMQAINAVRGPNGQIECASTVTNPGNGCVPLNIFGKGVASQAAINYVIGNPWNDAHLDQTVVSGNLHGSPFQDWAGPVSFAAGVEHRREATNSDADPQEAQTGTWFLAAGLPYSGAFAVTEGYLETDVPLAKDLPLAHQLDLNAAIRETDYDTFGLTHTWKVGVTWSPIDDLRFRATRSLDIREPTLVDLYQAGVTTSNSITDPFNGNATVAYRSTTTGNPNLVPERASNTVAGLVYQPSWLPRFSASVDYYIINITGGITSFSAQQLINLCYEGGTAACSTFTRTTSGGSPLIDFTIQPLNFATEDARRLEIESNYSLPLDSVVSSWKGTLAFRGAVTHYISDLINSGAPGSIPIQNAGVNLATGLPSWKYSTSADYEFEHYSLMLTARGLSAGVYSHSNVDCTSDCPASTANNVTVSNNRISGALYFDLSAGYHFNVYKADSEIFFSVRNLMNRNPPIVAMGPGATGYDFFPANVYQYDVLGRVMRLGLRVQF
jgi:iron complex outermembrane recepter protein